MTSSFKAIFYIGIFAFLLDGSALAQGDPRMSDRVLGRPDAPVKVDEFVSLTCTHCADFYTNILPELEKRYVDTGKVKFVMHDFPLDGTSLKAAAVARCMPADEYFPFVKILYKNQATWAFSATSPVDNMIQYAKLGGLSQDEAKTCANDEKLQTAIIGERVFGEKYQVEATPTFVLNDGAEIIKGAQTADTFAAAFDRLLTVKK